ncbi:MAG TPA: LytS/YhcK type 5TM receptor domain-containing protein, partial [Methanomassiliicoccales archaeon]|nr:LytS/YhcK type 5TM receptor domain-containing protein [Methanomassiliicoccales archaeon]
TLARRDSVFAGLGHLPGPKNWGIWSVTFVYVFEVVVFAGIASLSGAMLSELFGSALPAQLLAFSILAVVLVILLLRSHIRLERAIYAIIACVLVLLAYATIAAVAQNPGGVMPTTDALGQSMGIDVVLMIGSGSGLSLLLYSVWLSDKARLVPEGESMAGQLRDIRRSLALAFLLTGLIVTAIIVISYAAGAMAVQDAAGGLSGLPMASEAFVIATFLMMTGVVLVSVDGRARAISKMLRQTGTMKMEKQTLYNLLVLLFVAVICLALVFGAPTDALNLIASISSLMFALTGFALVYMNFGLPDELRGGRVWVAVTLVGSALFLAIAIVAEQSFLEFGVPMLLELGVVTLVLYVLARRGIFTWMIANLRRASGFLAMTLVFAAISIAGSSTGISYDGALVNFRDLGAMMAGLIGGPVVGGAVGLIGGLYRYSLGGWTALPCFVATLSAGILSGLLSVYWKGKINYLKAAFVAVLCEMMHLYLYLPLLTLGAPLGDVEALMRALTIPMLITNLLGILLFVYVLDRTKVLELDMRTRSEAEASALAMTEQRSEV